MPPGAKRTGDAASLGTPLETPTRRPRTGQLTDRQKARNRRVSKRRIVVERGIGKMKVWRIAAERYRNPRRSHTMTVKNIAGLHDRMYA
jgi:transposase